MIKKKWQDQNEFRRWEQIARLIALIIYVLRQGGLLILKMKKLYRIKMIRRRTSLTTMVNLKKIVKRKNLKEERLELVQAQEEDMLRKQVVLSYSKTKTKIHAASFPARNIDLTAILSLWGNSLWHLKNQLAQEFIKIAWMPTANIMRSITWTHRMKINLSLIKVTVITLLMIYQF